MKLAAISIFALFIGQAFAGGDYFPIKLTDFVSDGDTFEFKATPVVERGWMEKECMEVNVKGSYDTLRWLTYKSPMSIENHMIAIGLLEASYRAKQIVYFGYIGGGLHRVSRCSYKSKGLMYSQNLEELVMSIHDPI